MLNKYNRYVLSILKALSILKLHFNFILFDIIFIKKINLLKQTEKIFLNSFSTRDIFKLKWGLDVSSFNKSLYRSKTFFKKNTESLFTKDLFRSFIYLNTWLPTPRVQVHASFNIFYLYNKDVGIGCFNLKRVFQAWTNIIVFITNIFFYKLNYLAFGNSYFKYEILSLNWYSFNLTKFLWRYSHPFIFFLKNRTTLENKEYFDFLIQKNYKIAFVVDIQYHSRTIHYFNKYKFITIGAVPISSNFFLLTVSLPTSSNLIFSNLFFLRLILKIKKSNAKLVYNNYKNIKF